MKKALAGILWLLLLAGIASAADLNFEWDPMPAGQAWELVRIYEIVDGSYNLVAEAPGDQTTATVTDVAPGNHVYIARSFQATLESADSNQVSQDIEPSAPNLRIIAVYIAEDGTVTFKLVDPAEFFRG